MVLSGWRFRGPGGGNGQGPGEFGALFALDIDSAGFVHVLDPRNQRISVFEAEGGSFRLHDEISQIIGLDLCVLGSRRYVLSYASLGGGNLIHEVGDDGGSLGDPEGSFGLRVLRINDGVEVMRQTSPIRVVDGASERVVGYATHPFPRVAVY